ncbi:MAG: hypothetical protein DLD55_00815 [candidate division SR1 bacterium]|nr:MAG: hypothetical protein DLD55_00815 [candidate division SR1 bacterium]
MTELRTLYSELFILHSSLGTLHGYTQNSSLVYSELFTGILRTLHWYTQNSSLVYSELFTGILRTLHWYTQNSALIYSELSTGILRTLHSALFTTKGISFFLLQIGMKKIYSASLYSMGKKDDTKCFEDRQD